MTDAKQLLKSVSPQLEVCVALAVTEVQIFSCLSKLNFIVVSGEKFSEHRMLLI